MERWSSGFEKQCGCKKSLPLLRTETWFPGQPAHGLTLHCPLCKNAHTSTQHFIPGESPPKNNGWGVTHRASLDCDEEKIPSLAVNWSPAIQPTASYYNDSVNPVPIYSFNKCYYQLHSYMTPSLKCISYHNVPLFLRNPLSSSSFAILLFNRQWILLFRSSKVNHTLLISLENLTHSSKS
jgi:hypothetical protein